MKLYKFDFNDYLDNCRISKYIYECEEKPKTYILKESAFKNRIPKEEIGTVQNWAGLYIILTEDDFEKAKKIYLNYYEHEIESENARHEQQIKKFKHKIELIMGSKE